MAQYSRATLTDAGVQIARRMMDDDTITMTFTGIASGDGNYSTGEDIAARTALKNQIQFFPLSSKKVTSDNVLHLKYIISNVNPDDTPLTVGYYVREIGIYAQVDSEPAVLYAIAIADSATADYLPEYDSLQPSTITMDWFLTVGNAENVSIAASPSAYALASDLAATNAVVVTKLTASGGDAADAIIGSATASAAEYPVPAANDTFKVILGKIIKFCADIVKTFTGATSSAAGKKGLVPQPAAGDQNDYLRGDSTWQTPVNNALATAAGGVLDARMGKTLQDQITSLNDSLSSLNHLNTGSELHDVVLRDVMWQCSDKTITVFGYDVSCTIKPDDDPGIIYCFRLSSQYAIYLVVTYTGKIFTRALYNGTWTGWKAV